ncbi:hypothetical protein E4T66_12910 [Sinimarinibacterium sp. CAU 1509]|uniref:hypothetical protein n=1 Tax=Sinimarinibacterium sp. CAU 1509 TaxID=2562283 RepID=UPI0010AD95FB|nr:hypothetical protein [Sinimarinibacterium sp. CAU 1509]TJY59296.1 hypothetical protein E4T66_12910 [Sinimarinibacterium sp. CAU 1509]
MRKSLVLTASLAGLVFLAGCGGGGGSSSPTDTTPPTPTAASGTVAVSKSGPLDPLQTQLSANVFGPLASALGDTPLENVVNCADAIVAQDVIDIADTVLVSLQAAGAGAPNPDPQALVDSLRSVVTDLVQMIQGLAGTGSACLSNVVSAEQIAGVLSQLDGTPLAPLSTQLGPVLARIVAMVGGSGPVDQDLQLSTIASLVNQLNVALQLALAQIPSTAYDAPVVGGALTTVSDALNDTSALLNAVLGYDSAATNLALQNLLNNTLGNLLTQVVPLETLEEQAGQPGAISTPLLANIAQLSALVGATVSSALDPVFTQLLDGALAPVLDPIENQVLPAILGPIFDAIGGMGANPDTSGPLAGTPLAAVTNLITGVLDGLLGGAVGGGSGGGTGECLLMNVPILSILCGVA